MPSNGAMETSGSAAARSQAILPKGVFERRTAELGGGGWFGGGVGEGALVFALEEALADKDVDEVPGQGFVGVALAVDVPIKVEAGGFNGLVPALGF